VTTLVTGATGFVGSRIARALLARGEAVRVLARAGADRRNLAGLAAGVEPFQMRVEGLGSFPPKGPPRVLWARPLEHGTPLRALAADLRRAARRHGLEPESKPFHPHLTLGRVKHLPPESDLPARMAAWKHTLVGVLPAPALVLYASEPGAPPGEYRVLGRWELGTALPGE